MNDASGSRAPATPLIIAVFGPTGLLGRGVVQAWLADARWVLENWEFPTFAERYQRARGD